MTVQRHLLLFFCSLSFSILEIENTAGIESEEENDDEKRVISQKKDN